jgi:aminopeptidase N
VRQVEFLEDHVSLDDKAHHLALSAARYISETARYVRPIVTRRYDQSWGMFDGHLYPGGAWRLHMLRNKLGNDVFWRAITRYISDNMWGLVEPSDLRHALERESGVSLAKFFDVWFEVGVGFPVLEVSVSYAAERSGLTTITVAQKQVDATRGIRLFADISVEIALEVDAGVWESHTVDMDDDVASGGVGRVVLRLARKPLQVVVDPNSLLLHKLAKCDFGEDLLKRSLRSAPTYNGRLMAIYQLLKSGSRSAVSALCEALTSETHWGMRCMIAKSLGDTGKPAARDSLLVSLDREMDKRVIVFIMQGLQSYRDAEMMGPPLARFIEESDEKQRGYLAIMNALVALGMQRDPQYVKLLSTYLEDPALRGKGSLVHKGAIRGLGATRCGAALEVLLRNARVGMLPSGMVLSSSTRATIMTQIGTCVLWEPLETRIRAFEFLETVCLSDPDYTVRLGAGRGLCAVADAGSTGRALDVLAKDAVNQDVAAVQGMQRAAAGTRAKRNAGSGRESAAALEKSQDEIKVMRSRIDVLEAMVKENLVAKHVNVEASADVVKKVADNENGDGGVAVVESIEI